LIGLIIFVFKIITNSIVMSYLILPKNYKALIDLKQTEQGIKQIKDSFQKSLSSELRLRRVTAPLFVLSGTGINDNLSGKERPVQFHIKDMNEQSAEIVHSLAKWKRLTLAEYKTEIGYGIYTDMNAIRADEELGNLHSLYVDQWDWEVCIEEKDRNIKRLKSIVKQIYAAIRQTEYLVYEQFPNIPQILPENITFIHSEELVQKYPDLSPRERENRFTKEHKAVFVIGIGGLLSNGKKHDERAPDYDDWTTPNEDGYFGLNGDLLVWNEVLGCSFELSSMGIRVDKNALLKQLNICGCTERKDLYFHKKLLNDELPLSIGGGIGQSRLCMFLLRKGHIGEIQASIWPEEMRETCNKYGMNLI
jgi:aspartate--ammonia ligase